MKKKVFFGVIIAILLVSATVMAAETGTFEGFKIINLKVDGKDIAGDVPAILFNGRTMVPIRFVSEALGANVDFDDSTNTAIIKSSQGTRENVSNVAITFKNLDGTAKYSGETLNDYPDGYGKMVYPNGDIYEGYFSQGKLNGKGKYTHKNGETVMGTYTMGNYDGIFKRTFPDGKISFVEYKNGVLVGKALTQFNDKGNTTIAESTYEDGKESSVTFYSPFLGEPQPQNDTIIRNNTTNTNTNTSINDKIQQIKSDLANTLLSLNSEIAKVKSDCDNKVSEINKSKFAEIEKTKEMLNQYGWPIDSGLGKGEIDKVSKIFDDQITAAQNDRDNKIADIQKSIQAANDDANQKINALQGN